MRRYGMYGLGAMNYAAIKAAQTDINTVLVQMGYLPIKADGILGPKTCGAARAVNHPSLAEMGCKTFTEPARNPAGPPVPPVGPNAPPGPVGPIGPGPAIAPAHAPAAAGMFGLDTKTILIGAGVIGVGVVIVYALKKKSQAAA